MLTLNDGRSELWQWDTGRKLTVDADCSQVHFSNKIFGRSIDVDVVDGVAIIPDILLQTDKDLNVWAFVGTSENGYTKISKTFKVNRRNKPADYVFTPLEQTTLAEIMERLDDLEAIQDPDAIKNAVDDYLANNPIEVKETDPTVPEWAKRPNPPDVKIPDKLPNPHSINFTGAVNASYDGSSSVEIKIPDSGGNVELDTTLTQSGKAADAKAVGDKIAEITGISLVEPADDDIPKIFFGGALQQTKDEAVVPFRYISKTNDFSGYAEIKAQGNSSMNYPKKNQTVKMFADEACESKMKKDFKGWGKQNKHVYKANWIDLTHARNIVSARLWADVVKSRADYESLPELFRTTPNQGAVDGFPVKVYAAGVYQGRYTLNIPKDKWTFNMDDELDEHCALCGENYASGCFRAAAYINESDWTDEIHDTVPASIKTRWNEVISFVMNSTDKEFRANLNQYFYVDSLIDYYLFALASCGLDAMGKNQIYLTYNGQRWIASMYDMDSTWGLYYTGGKIVATDYSRTSYEDFVNGRQGNLLYIRLEHLFWSELQTRWAELKNGALSITNIINRFERFTDIAPAELVKEDYASTTGGGKFTGIPGQTTNNIQQIRSFALARQAWTDEYVSGLTPEVQIPCVGISLNTNALTFTAEGSQTLIATVTPDGCTDPVTWESDNTSVATVNGGVVTALANGNAIITAKCGEYSANCSVAISGIAEPVPCTGISLDKTELTFDGEGTQNITVTLTPSDTTDTVVWTSSNQSVAFITVSGNVCTVQSVRNGNAIITVTCGNHSASCSVAVSGIETLYSLPQETTFNGTSDYIDTGVQLAKEDIDFTIVMDATAGKNSRNGAVYHCVNEAFPYPGYLLGVHWDSDFYRASNWDVEAVTAIPKDDVRFKYVITHASGSEKAVMNFLYNGTVYPYQTTFNYSSVEQNLLIGAYQTTSGVKGRFWAGTLHDFKVYNRAFTELECYEYLGAITDASSITWSDSATRRINNGVFENGSNYVTNYITLPNGITSVTMQNSGAAQFAYFGAAQFDADMAFIKFTEVTTGNLELTIEANTAYVVLSAYPATADCNDPANQISVVIS